eukprot:2031327-Alexandrium_andersonii.AAC.1
MADVMADQGARARTPHAVVAVAQHLRTLLPISYDLEGPAGPWTLPADWALLEELDPVARAAFPPATPA